MRKVFLLIITVILTGLIFFYFLGYDENTNNIKNILMNIGILEKPLKPYSQIDNTPFVYRSMFDEITKLNSTTERSQSLPNNLIIPPGKYSYFNQTYDLTSEGLYRFIHPLTENQQRIVYENDIDILLSSVAWIYTHGNSDDDKSFEELNEKALRSKIFGTCATISTWIQNTLSIGNVKSRVVQTLTLDDWNTYDNGHTMIEVYRDDYNKWVVYDLDNNAYFQADGEPLSLYEFLTHVKNDDYKIIFIADDTKLDVSNFKDDNGYEYGFLSESISANEDTLKKWYKRIIQIPLILEEDQVFYTTDSENEKELVEKYSDYYIYIEKEEFLKQFYP